MGLPMYWNLATTINNANYDDSHRYNFGLQSNGVQIHYRTGTNAIYYSFNGTDDHGMLNNIAGSIQTQLLEPFHANSVWLRGGTGDEEVEVSAWP